MAIKYSSTHMPESTIFLDQDSFVQKQIPPEMNTDDKDFKFKRVLLSFLIRVNQCNQCHQR